MEILILGRGKSAKALFNKLKDNNNVKFAIEENEKIIKNAISEGISEVELQVPTPFTKYNAAKGLVYLEEGDGKAWPNTDMAKYYGLKTVRRK